MSAPADLQEQMDAFQAHAAANPEEYPNDVWVPEPEPEP